MMRTCSPSRRAQAMTHRAVALGLIALVWGAAGLGAQTGTGTITGHVTDSATGRPVVAVRLSVVGTDRTAVTAEDGGFVLAAVPAGAPRGGARPFRFSPPGQDGHPAAGSGPTLNLSGHPPARP